MGLPGTSSFVSEFMVLAAAFKSNIFITVLAATVGFLGQHIRSGYLIEPLLVIFD